MELLAATGWDFHEQSDLSVDLPAVQLFHNSKNWKRGNPPPKNPPPPSSNINGVSTSTRRGLGALRLLL